MDSQPKIPLTSEQLLWIKNIESDFDDLPVGLPEALVRLYLIKPEFFSKENVEKMRAEPPPKLNKTMGEMNIVTGDEDAEIQKTIDALHAPAETLPIAIEKNVFEEITYDDASSPVQL